MILLRLFAFLLAALLHGAFALPFLLTEGVRALDSGFGDDLLRIEQGIAIEGLLKLGEAETASEAQDMPMAEASQAQTALEEVKALEAPDTPVKPERETVQSKDQVEVISAQGAPEQEIKTVEGPAPAEEPLLEEFADGKSVTTPALQEEPPELEQPRPSQVAAVNQIEQYAVEEQQSSAEEEEGGDPTIRAAYLGKLRLHLERYKVRPEAKATGVTVVKFTVGPSGDVLSREVVSSSGSKKLDEAALATIERSAPFPPFPEGIAQEPVVVSVPFKFRAGR